MMPLGALDLAVLAAYFVGILSLGFYVGRGERDTHDFFLGGRNQHWLIVGLSIVATEVSALKFLIVPGRSFETNFWYLQMYAGSIVGRLVIVYLLLPAFYRSEVTTVYEYLGLRFGPWTRSVASLMFFASRIIGSGIRLLAASLALALIFDIPLTWVVFGAAGVAILYSTFGGIKAIIWTDALQALVFLGGAVAVVIFLFVATPGSWTQNLATAYDAEKFRTITWGWNFNNDKVFWVLAIHAVVQNMAAFGADQDLTQRMLTCPDLRRAQRSLIFNTVMGLPVVCLFLLIGALLFVYYDGASQAAAHGAMDISPDRIFAHFIATALPTGIGLKGLLVAGVFAAAMSSLDSALGALSSSAVTDWYRPLMARRRRKRGTRLSDTNDRVEMRVARGFTVLFGLLLAGVALMFADSTQLLEDTFGWVGLIFGGMLGVFLLGATTRTRGNDRINAVAMLSSVLLLVVVKAVQEKNDVVYVAWPWWIVIGTAWTYLTSCSFKATPPSTAAAFHRNQ